MCEFGATTPARKLRAKCFSVLPESSPSHSGERRCACFPLRTQDSSELHAVRQIRPLKDHRPVRATPDRPGLHNLNVAYCHRAMP